MSENACLSPSQTLSEEFDSLRPESGYQAVSEPELYRKVHQEKNPLTALCFSGGGIRSATFALGVIQGLAEKGVLGGFDYLSTVSGGGYIGSWLTSWKHRVGGLDQVVPHLRRSAPPPPPGTPDPIQHLREYNSYLSPKVGAFSTDTWTLAATVVRNMMLNWLVFVPLLMGVLMLPRLILSLARLGEIFDMWYGNSPPVTLELLATVLPMVAGCLFAIAVYNTMRYLPGIGRKDHDEFDFLKFVFLPALGAAFAFLTNDAWFTGGDATRTTLGASAMTIGYKEMVRDILGSGLAGWFAYLLFCGKSMKERLRLLLPVTAAVVLMGLSAGSATWLLMQTVYPATTWPVYTTVACPLLVLAFLLAGCLFVGFSSKALKDEDREWMSRAGAWVLLFIVSWTAVCSLVLIAPMWAFTLPVWGKSLLGAAGAIGGWTSALASSSSKTRATNENPTTKVSGMGSIVASVATKLAAPLFVIAFLVGLAVLTNWLLMITGLGAHSDFETWQLSSCPHCEWWDHRGLVEGTRWESSVVLGLAFVLFSWFVAKFVNINEFSLHAMYRNRLVRAYLGASNNRKGANKFTGFAGDDDLPMHELDVRGGANLRPFHVVNVTLNLVAGQRLAWQQRKAESFTISPLHCGSYELGYRPSAEYGGEITLGTAVTISGAAASPNMGYHSSPLIGFIMTLFDARLGSWLGNPGSAGSHSWRKPGPTSAFGSLVKEAFGLTNNKSEYVYLSDGGHFENLAVYEMVRRRCRYIVVSDGGCDQEFTYGDLGNALRKIRIDLKIPITFEDGAFQRFRRKEQRWAIARIGYSAVDDTKDDGYLLYIKPMIRFNEPPDVVSYYSDNPAFPHQSTADQFFDESQTESYRTLGQHTMDELCEGWDGAGGIAGLFRHVSGTRRAGMSA